VNTPRLGGRGGRERNGVNTRATLAIVRKDLKVALRNRMVLLPTIIVGLLMMVLLPAGVGLAPQLFNVGGSSTSDMSAFLAKMPGNLRSEIAGLSESQTMIYLMLLYFMAPLYLIVPLMVASVVAADSFAGEKERKTLEALLYSPTSDRELFQAKLMAAWVAAVTIAWLGFIAFGVAANVAAWPIMGRVFFPNVTWVVLALFVAPAVAGMGLGATVIVSARAQGFQDAYQGGSMLVLPLVALMVFQATGVMYLSTWLVAGLGLVIWALDVALIWYGGRTFRRSEIITRF